MKNKFILIALLLGLIVACHSDDDSTSVYITSGSYDIDYTEQTLYVGVSDVNQISWTFHFEDDWITTSRESGDSSRIFEIYVEANTSLEERETYGILTFFENGIINYDTLSVTQEGEELQVYLPDDSLVVASTGGIVPFAVGSNMSYSVRSEPYWLTTMATRVINMDTMYLDVEANPLYGYREGYVIFNHDDDYDVADSLYVFQYGIGDISTDSLALIALYNSAGGANWTNKWDLSEPLTDWYGVTVGSVAVGNRVTSLRLSNNNLVGTIPDEIVQVAYLNTLMLNDNTLSGSIPTEIGTMVSLSMLYLYNNELSGEIPSGIGGCYRMTRLHLYNNEFTGNIPESIGNMTELAALGLHNNSMKGSLPEYIGDIETLYTLTLYNNKLSGTIPSSYAENDQCGSWNAATNICPQQEGFGFYNCESLYYPYGN